MMLLATSFASVAVWLVPSLIAVGIVFCIVEAIIPGFGFFGITGIIAFVGGIVCYGFIAEIWKLFVLILAVIFFLFMLFILISNSAKRGALGKTAFVENKTALPEDFDLEAMLINSKYINKKGKVIVACRPVGKISIDDEIIEVFSKNGMLEKGTIVKVVEVENDKIIVDEIKI